MRLNSLGKGRRLTFQFELFEFHFKLYKMSDVQQFNFEAFQWLLTEQKEMLKRVASLEKENSRLKSRIQEVEQILDILLPKFDQVEEKISDREKP